MKTKQNTNQLLCLVYAALFAAVTYVVTCYIHIPTNNGFVHPGDAFVFLVGCILPTPYAAVAAALGGSLGDLLSGGAYIIWVPATIIIKAATAACFTYRSEKIVCKRNLLALIPALIFCCGGYYLYESIVIAHNFIAPLASVIPNVLQVAVGAAIFILLGRIIDTRPQLKRDLIIKKDK